MARTTDAILRELDAFFEPTRQVIRQQQSQIDPRIQAQLGGLEAERTRTFGDITRDAQRRGLTFSGLPMQEQARYLGERFLPRQAELKQAGVEARTTLASQLAQLEKERGLLAQNIYQQELDRDAAERQARAAAAQTSGIQSVLAGLLGGEVAGAQSQAPIEFAEKAQVAQKAGVQFAERIDAQIPDIGTRAQIFNALVQRFRTGNLEADDKLELQGRINAMASRFKFRNPLQPGYAGNVTTPFVPTGAQPRRTRSQASQLAGL